MKEFTLDGQTYLFEYDANEERKVKLFLKTEHGVQDLHGNQKEIIVRKLYEIMQENLDIEIDESKRQYVENYVNGEDKSASETTNTLGRILDDCLENEVVKEVCVAFESNTRFVTYENRRNPHITIHKTGCAQIAKRGGVGEGEYNEFESFMDAENYAKSTNLEIRHCSFCFKGK